MKYFSFKEVVRSGNHPDLQAKEIPVDVAENVRLLAENILDPLREAYGKPICVNSWYRPSALNKAVGGVKNSQHLTGQAVDIRPVRSVELGVRSDEVKRLGKLIEELKLPFDQLIYEGTWIHVSYGPRHRRQVLYK